MSHKRAKEARRLAHHVEYGGNYPAMMRSDARLAEMRISWKEDRRSTAMALAKVQKQMCVSQREQERDEAHCKGHVFSEPGHAGWTYCVRCFKQQAPSTPSDPVVGLSR